ncbi:NAD(P)-dependent alcohol dehydrogenase [Pigmentibacter sp. JX0631]|uniref:NAD(P)-dependent alcohol dehydrogenase n=1 Tax=Pigmentibacter sp. JX0631 TaxID=2976982 RepID=UPI0024697DCA|nr:NAD(P)-dependent alcohol dehydrogenase [Pigmentibacter sp. JX0631]WGL60964.1 NAD(P)-dependent alcohol dehydrogenase [Pigmentibacter sp. JX0631]
MKSLMFESYGNSSVLKIVEENIPIPAKNEVLLKVKAAGINPLDWKIRNGDLKIMTGNKFPKYLGCEFSGIVEKQGNDITDNIVGKRIFGYMPNTMAPGAMREYICVPRSNVAVIPNSVSFEEAAGVIITCTAAHQAITELAQAKAGQSILINGCSGGLGLFALQIAKNLQLKITGTASGDGIAIAKEFGCPTVIDYKKTDVLVSNEKYDIILELSGRMPFSQAKKIMQDKSVFINPSPDLGSIIFSIFHNLFSGKKIKLLMTKYSQEKLNLLIDLMNKNLKIKVNKIYPFSEVIKAYQETEIKSPIGKNIIKFD